MRRAERKWENGKEKEEMKREEMKGKGKGRNERKREGREGKGMKGKGKEKSGNTSIMILKFIITIIRCSCILLVSEIEKINKRFHEAFGEHLHASFVFWCLHEMRDVHALHIFFVVSFFLCVCIFSNRYFILFFFYFLLFILFYSILFYLLFYVMLC
jgi:hypothetical protein